MNYKKTKKAVVRRVYKLGELAEQKFQQEDLVNVLSNITFDLININLSIEKKYVGINGTGYTSIGYVNGFNKETNEFTVVLHSNREEAIDNLGEVVIVARAFTNKDNNITKIISLDIKPLSEDLD